MEDKKLVIPAPVGAVGDDVTTWALPEGAIARLGQGLVETLAFSPDSQHLAIGTRVGLWLYEIETMSPVALWAMERGVFGTTFSPDGKWIATSDWDNVIKVWDVQRGVCLTHIETAWNNFTFSSDSRWFATSYRETATINVWHPETGEMLTKFAGEVEKGGRFMPIAFSPDIHLIASTGRESVDSNGESVLLWSVEQGEQITRFTGHTSSIYSLCFSPCGRFLVSGGRKDGTIRVWDVVNCQQTEVYTGYGAVCMIPSYSSEGILRATAISYNEMFKDNAIIMVWNLEDGEKIYANEESIGEDAIVDFSSGLRLVYESGEGGIKVWHFGKPHAYKSNYQPISFPNTVSFASDGKTLVVEYREGRRLYSHGDVLFWDLTSKCSSRAVETEPIGTRQFFFSDSDGKRHIVSLDNGTVRLWEVEDKAVLIAEFTEHEKKWIRAAFAPRVNRLACLDEAGILVVWELEAWKKSANSHTDTSVFLILRWRRWNSVQTERYCSVKRIAVRPLDSGMWKMVKRFSNFQVMKSVESWGFGIIEDFLRAVRTLRAAKREPKNCRMERLSACGTSDRGKSSRRYRFGMHSYLPILRVVRIWHAVGKTQKASCCGISNVVKSVGG